MSGRRDHFCQLTIAVWISAMAFFPTVTSCIPGKIEGGPTVDVEDGTGGARGTGGTRAGTGGRSTGTGGRAGTVALACSATPSGCLCADRDSQPTDVAMCNEGSVAKSVGEQGACCRGADLCTCDSYACKSDPDLGFCQCAPIAAIAGALQGEALTECPAPAATDSCCFAMDTHSCVCSAADCEADTMMVDNCTLAVVQVCGADDQSATSCK